MQEHFSDPYVKKTKVDGYRSRASYKLLELNEKDRFFRKGMTVVDLGAAPGGWSQVAAGLVGDQGCVIATDILPMDGLPDVEFIQGDFTEQQVLDQIVASLGESHADLVISDMAPNMSGMQAIDQPKSLYLVELAVDMAKQVLKNKGVFVSKVFQGEGFDVLYQDLKKSFDRVISRKPDASRARSREIYVVASGFKRPD